MAGDERLFERVKAQVRGAIRAGLHPIGSVLPDAEVLARRSKCSLGTVRRALTELAREGIVRRIQAKGTVVAALPPAGSAVLVLSHDMHANLLFQQPTYAALTAAGLEVEILPLSSLDDADVRRTAARCEAAARRPGAGTIAVAINPKWAEMPAGAADELRAALAGFARVAAVSLDDARPPVDGGAVVVVDQQHAARVVLQHLVGLGHRRIAVIGSDDAGSTAGESLAACRHLAAMAGAEVLPHGIGDGFPPLVRQLRAGAATAYWAITDHYAALLLGHCRDAGVEVPARASVVGRNDTPWSAVSYPPLTTLSLEPAAMAAAMVAAVTADQPRDGVIRVAPRLIVRGSTGPAPKEARGRR